MQRLPPDESSLPRSNQFFRTRKEQRSSASLKATTDALLESILETVEVCYISPTDSQPSAASVRLRCRKPPPHLSPYGPDAPNPHHPAHRVNIVKLKEALEQRLGRYLATTDSAIKIIKTAVKSTCKEQQATKAEGESRTLPSDLRPPAPGSFQPALGAQRCGYQRPPSCQLTSWSACPAAGTSALWHAHHQHQRTQCSAQGT